MLLRPLTRRCLPACARRARSSLLLLCNALTLGEGTQEPPPHVPAWLPAFPDKHTCARTARAPLPCMLGCLAAAADPASKRVACTEAKRPASCNPKSGAAAGGWPEKRSRVSCANRRLLCRGARMPRRSHAAEPSQAVLCARAASRSSRLRRAWSQARPRRGSAVTARRRAQVRVDAAVCGARQGRAPAAARR